jgi:hypothetical protein
MMDLSDCGTKYKVPADPFYFRKETRLNHKCDNCKSMIWTALLPEHQSDWVKVSDYGFVHRRFAHRYLELVEKKPKIYEAILAIANSPNGHFSSSGAYRRFPLSTYIKRQMKGKIDGLIIDELHNFNNNSGQGDAMGELLQAAKKVVGMTATLINGYSSGIFHLLYRISPDLMLRDNKGYDKDNLSDTVHVIQNGHLDSTEVVGLTDADFISRDANKIHLSLGRTVITCGAQDELDNYDIQKALRRHQSGDWGDVSENDRKANDNAVKNGERVLSSYVSSEGEPFWIITEWDRSVTTVLLPDEY